MPASLSLPRLHTLALTYCRSLQSLLELPSSIARLDANHCTSLKTFSYPPSAYGLRNSRRLIFEISNCFQLVKNEQSDIVEAILLGIRLVASVPKYLHPDQVSLFFCVWIFFAYAKCQSIGAIPQNIPLHANNVFIIIQVFRSPCNGCDAIVLGSSILEWFAHQSVGSLVTVELLWHWSNTKLKGLVVYALVDVEPEVSPTVMFPGFVYFLLGDGCGGLIPRVCPCTIIPARPHVIRKHPIRTICTAERAAPPW